MSALPTFAEILANCTVYKPRVGNKARTFKTEAEAQAYEWGWHVATAGYRLPFSADSAFRSGYFDAEAADQARHEARAEAQAERWER